MAKVLEPCLAGNSLTVDLQVVPSEVSTLIVDCIFHGASGVLTSVAMHYPGLDFRAIGDGYAARWSPDRVRELG